MAGGLRLWQVALTKQRGQRSSGMKKCSFFIPHLKEHYRVAEEHKVHCM